MDDQKVLRDTIEADLQSSLRSLRRDRASRTRLLLLGPDRVVGDPDPSLPLAFLFGQTDQLMSNVLGAPRAAPISDEEAKAGKIKEICDVLWVLELLGIACHAQDEIASAVSQALAEAHSTAEIHTQDTPGTEQCCRKIVELRNHLWQTADKLREAPAEAKETCLYHAEELAGYLGYICFNERIALPEVTHLIRQRVEETKDPKRAEHFLRFEKGTIFRGRFLLSDAPGVYARLLAVLDEEASADLIISASCAKLPGQLAEAIVVFETEIDTHTRDTLTFLLREQLSNAFLSVIELDRVSPNEVRASIGRSLRSQHVVAQKVMLLYRANATAIASGVAESLREFFDCEVDTWEHDLGTSSAVRADIEEVARSDTRFVLLETEDMTQREEAEVPAQPSIEDATVGGGEASAIILRERTSSSGIGLDLASDELDRNNLADAALRIARLLNLPWRNRLI